MFVCAATGGGKSLCYQAFGVPGVADGRSVLVFSPLIAIMKEQVSELVILELKGLMNLIPGYPSPITRVPAYPY